MAQYKRMDNVSSIHWVCDRHDKKKIAPRNLNTHDETANQQFCGAPSGNKTVPQWKELLFHPSNKANLLQFICEDWWQKVKKLFPSKLKYRTQQNSYGD